MGKRLATVGIVAAIGIGGLGVAAINPLSTAGAQQDATAATEPTAGERVGPLRRALDALVADGTITQAQADAVLERAKAEAQAGRAERKERFAEKRAEVIGAAAEALGTTPEAVTDALADGTSIAEQAEAAGVDRAVVADAIRGVLSARIDAAIADGRMTEERAAKVREHLDGAVDRILDADGTHRGHGRGRGRHGG